MNENDYRASIYLGKKTKELAQGYADENEISLSAVVKLAIHKFLRELK